MAQTPETEQAGQLMWHGVTRLGHQMLAASMLILVIAAMANEARADEPAVVPAFQQKIIVAIQGQLLSVPLTFQQQSDPDYAADDGRQSLLEFVPDGQTVYEWTELVSIRSFTLDVFSGARSMQVMDMLAQTIYQACPTSFVYEPVPEKMVDGLPATVALIGCKSTENMMVPGLEVGQAEIGLYTVVETPSAYVEAHYSRRTGDVDGFDSPSDPAVVAVVSGFTKALRFCANGADTSACR